jgi:hypothetical protein
MAAFLATRAVYAARDDALRIARTPLNLHHYPGRKAFALIDIAERMPQTLRIGMTRHRSNSRGSEKDQWDLC